MTARMDAATRNLVRVRASNRCEYCGLRQEQSPLASLHVEHVVPKKHGGSDDPDNLALACIDCNKKKDNLLLEQAGMVLRHAPHKPSWSPRMVLQQVENTPANWERFVSDAYWNTELR